MALFELAPEEIEKIAQRTAEILKKDKNFNHMCKEDLIKEDLLFSVEDLHKLSKIQKQTIYRHIKNGLLIGKKVGKTFLFTKENIDNYLKSK